MNGIKCLIGVMLVIGLLGCENRSGSSRGDVDASEVQSSMAFGGFTASMLTDGSLKLELREGGKVVAETTVPGERVYPGNAVTGVASGEVGLGPWCIAHCHVNPSTTMYVAWNTETDEVLASPGYTFGMIRSGDGEDVLVTLNRAHFDRSPDPAVAIFVNGVELVKVGNDGWKVTGYTTNSMTLTGTTFLDESIRTVVTFAGEWGSGSGKTYDVYHVYNQFQAMTRHSNIRGVSRIFFVRDGEVAASWSCDGLITIQDGELFENYDETPRPWDPEGRFTDEL